MNDSALRRQPYFVVGILDISGQTKGWSLGQIVQLVD
jgi:hypothetical protein